MAQMLVLLLAAVFAALSGPEVSPRIHVDQVGYLPAAAKYAVVASPGEAAPFALRRAADDRVVYRGRLSPARIDESSGDTVRLADFSAVKAAGEYYVDVPGVGRSYGFRIAPDVYQRAFYLAMRAFYGQRCGSAVDLGPEFPDYKHAICHTAGAWDPSSGRTGPRGSYHGWHDAGDYGRYVVNSGATVSTLLWAYELFPDRVRSIDLHIPESGDASPDILDEVRWNLDWMLTMQDSDGGVWQ
ncbi:MAG TPA: glycoside hydrolase family 9 protein, partial [Longimicrobiales bacterium]